MRGHAAPGVTGRQLASRASPSLSARQPARSPARPGLPAARAGPAAGAPGLGGGCSAAARPRAVTCGRSPWRPPGAAATRRATLRTRGYRALLPEGAAALAKAPPGYSGMYVFGARGVSPGPPPPPARPPLLGGRAPLSSPRCTESSRVIQ